MKQKNPKTLFAGSIASAVLAAVMLIVRIAIGAEKSALENSYAAIVIVGTKEMSRSDYLAHAAKMNTVTTVLVVVLALMAGGLYMMYKKSKEQ